MLIQDNRLAGQWEADKLHQLPPAVPQVGPYWGQESPE